VQSGVVFRPPVLSVPELPVPELPVPELLLSARRLDPAELSDVEPRDVEPLDADPEPLVSVRPIPIPEQALTDASTRLIANTEQYDLRSISIPLR